MPEPITPSRRDGAAFAAARREALEDAADSARLAPSIHNTQPWALVLGNDALQLRADRDRLVPAMDPLGRGLVISIGAALLNVRATLAAAGWTAEVTRLPRPGDVDLLAEVRPATGCPDGELAVLAQVIRRRHTNRRPFTGEALPDDTLVRLTELAAADEVHLVPVLRPQHRALVARLTQQAERLELADPAYRAELRRWTTRDPAEHDGIPPSVVPHAEGTRRDATLIRNFDTRGTAMLPAESGPGPEPTLILLATLADDRLAWLCTGEAMQRILLELTRLDWKASPVTQPLELPVTRAELRGALTHAAHPQMLLRVGRAAPTTRTPRRRRADVVRNSTRPAEPAPAQPPPERSEQVLPPHRPVSDGRGGTTWTR